MSEMKPVASAGRAAGALSLAALFGAVAWMMFRIFHGIDFTDEMQYYGEIAALVRTGRLFQEDLFIQQLGYFFLLPFFRVHAWLFPGQDYFVLFGRLLLLAGYAVAGWRVWRAARGFSQPLRITALALLFGWIPFQLFAPSYNTMSLVLCLWLGAVWLERRAAGARGEPLGIAIILALLGFVYPPVGITLSVALGLLCWRREGFFRAVRLALWTLLAVLLILTVMVVWHGQGFWDDLLVSVEFSGAISVGQAILQPSHLLGLVCLLGAGAVFFWRLRPAADTARPAAPAWACVLVGAMVALEVARRLWTKSWEWSYAPHLLALFLLVLLAAWLGRQKPADRPRETMLARWGLLGFGLLWFYNTMPWGTGFFAAGIFLVLLACLIAGPRPPEAAVELVALAFVSGVTGAVASGNGLHNFGVGCAAFLPLLACYAGARLEPAWPGRGLAALALVLLPLGLVINGMRHPYREQTGLDDFIPIPGVPAYKGISTSPEKIRALAIYRALETGHDLQGRRVLVIGPQPWIYFASRSVPTTPMLFMHFDGNPKVDQILADRLFIHGEPEFIVVTASMPVPVQQRVLAWLGKDGMLSHIPFPPDFKASYEAQTHYFLGDSMLLMTRKPKAP